MLAPTVSFIRILTCQAPVAPAASQHRPPSSALAPQGTVLFCTARRALCCSKGEMGGHVLFPCMLSLLAGAATRMLLQCHPQRHHLPATSPAHTVQGLSDIHPKQALETFYKQDAPAHQCGCWLDPKWLPLAFWPACAIRPTLAVVASAMRNCTCSGSGLSVVITFVSSAGRPDVLAGWSASQCNPCAWHPAACLKTSPAGLG